MQPSCMSKRHEINVHDIYKINIVLEDQNNKQYMYSIYHSHSYMYRTGPTVHDAVFNTMGEMIIMSHHL